MRIFELDKKYVLGAVWVFGAAILLASKAIWIKLAYRHEEITTLALLSLRMLFSLPFYLLIIWQQRSRIAKLPLSPKNWIGVLVMGLIGYYLASLFDFLGLRYISASLERLLLFIYPTMVVLLASYWFKRKIKRTQIFALLLTYFGIFAIFAEQWGVRSSDTFWIGALWVLLAAFTYAIYLVGSEQYISAIGPKVFTAISMTSAAVGIFVHYFISQDFDIHTFPIEVYGLSIGMALLATVIPSFMLSIGIGLIGSSNTSIVGSIGPVATLVMAYFFLGERITLVQMAGTVFVLTGVLMISLRKG